MALYSQRLDKHWSFTGCISIEMMRDQGLTKALATDHHFAKAGFNVLF